MASLNRRRATRGPGRLRSPYFTAPLVQIPLPRVPPGREGNNILDSVTDGSYTESNYVAWAMRHFFPSPRYSSENIVIVLETYLDESGDAQAPVIVVAGVAATQPHWETFNQQWRPLLDKWGIEFFHMADFESRQGPYAEWSDSQRHERLNTLLALITSHAIIAVWAAVPKEVYERVIPDALKVRITPYHVAAISCFTRLNGILRNELGDRDVRAAYVYEDISKGSGAVLDAYSGIKMVHGLAEELHMLTLSYQPKKEFRPLQAADILAYEVWKDVTNILAGNPRRRRYPITQLEKSLDIRASLFRDAELHLLVPLLKQVFL